MKPALVWWASTSAAAPFVAHLLPPGQPSGRLGTSLCGEFRRSWQLRDEFARPEAFTPCTVCAQQFESAVDQNASRDQPRSQP